MTPMTLGQYNLQTMEFSKDEAAFANADEMIAHLKEQIDAHPVAGYIATFDHYAHTTGLAQHNIADDITAAQIIVFCFGPDLSVAQMAGMRPRSISVVEHNDKYTITFMNAPAPALQDIMTAWCEQLKK